MPYPDAALTYQKTNIETTDTLKLVIMCYDQVIYDIEAAKGLNAAASIEEAYEKVRHAQDIITELLVGLDYERGGEIARNLSRLYNYMLRELIGINARKNDFMYEHLIHLLSELREAWMEIRNRPMPQGAGRAQSWGISV